MCLMFGFKSMKMNTSDLDTLAKNASKAETLLKAMSNANRLMVLCSIAEGELSVGELNERIPLSQSSLSQHLAALRKAEIVQTRRESQTIYYRIQGEAPLRLIATLKDIFCP